MSAIQPPSSVLELPGCSRRPRALRHGKRERGVTLIESLIALLVLGIALLGVASLQLMTQREEIDARWRSIAVSMGGNLIEQLRTDRVAANGIEIQDNVVNGCNSPNQWLCTLVGDWRTSLAEQLPNVVAQLSIDDLGGDILLAQVSISWRRVAEPGGSAECRPQDDDLSIIDGGGCILLETAL